MLLPIVLFHLLACSQQFVLVVVQIITKLNPTKHSDGGQDIEVVFVGFYKFVGDMGVLAHELNYARDTRINQILYSNRIFLTQYTHSYIYRMLDSAENKEPEKQQDIYQRIRLLGTGSYGKAYLVRQRKTNNLYAIKQIDIAQLTEPEQENARKQAKIMEMLDHPNIIKFKQIYTTEKGKLNIVMQFADSGDLSVRIQQAKNSGKLLEEAEILNLFTQICLGIKHLHDRKIIHRDLKGQNIFLTESGCVKIGDMGVARVLEHTVAKAKTVVGTPYYLSPQIIENKPYSFKSDIWSLGALLYQMCALNPPFTANNLQYLALKIVRGAYPNIPAQYSQELRNLIKSMLHTNSNIRPNINQILGSSLINRRIKSLLTQSQNIKEFSHTVLHKFNVLKNQTEDKLRPPPNLIEIQQMNQNLSAIEMERKMMEPPNLEVKAKTPYCIGKNPPPIKKKPLIAQKKVRPNTAENLEQIMKIKATPLEQHVVAAKLPKVSPNPLKKRPETPKHSPSTQKIESKKNITSIIFNKKKSIDCTNFIKDEKIIQKPKSGNQLKLKPVKEQQQKFEESTKQVENVSENYLHKKDSQPINKIKLELKNQLNHKQKKQTKPAKIVTKPKPKPKKQSTDKDKQKKESKLQLVSQELKTKEKQQKQIQKKGQKKGVIRKSKGSIKKVANSPRSEINMVVNGNEAGGQVIEQQKCNQASDDKYETQGFEVYQPESEEDDNSNLSFALSDSSMPSDFQVHKQEKGGNQNYQKMLAELEIIHKIVEKGNGKVESLPILGSSIPELLELSNSVRQDDSDLESQQSYKNSSQQLSTPSNINLTYFNNQSELENLRITLEEIFGTEHIIKAYKHLSEIILEKQLDFNEEEAIRDLLKSCPGIEECQLRRHFRLIVTVIALELQLCKDENNF